MILNTHRNTSPRLAKARLGFITSAAALIAVLAIYSGPRLVLAQSQPPAPAPATPPAPAIPTAPPVALPQAPQAPLPPPHAPPPGTSIEERLARLEQMVQTLLAHQDTKRPRADDQDWAPGAKDQPFDPEEMELFKERVKREVARATGQAVRAMEEAKRAAKQAVSNYLRAEQSAPDSDLAPSPADKQLEALRIKREALQRAMQELDRHIQRLERDRERSAEDPQRRNETNAGQPKPEAPLSETPATK